MLNGHVVAANLPMIFWGAVFCSAVAFGMLGWGKSKVVAVFYWTLMLSSVTILFAHFVFPFSDSFFVISASSASAVLLILLSPPSLKQFKRFLELEGVISEQNSQFSKLTWNAYEGIYFVDPENFTYVDANPSGLKAIGYSLREIRELSIDAVHPDSHLMLKRKIEDALATNSPVSLQIWATKKQGEKLFVELLLTPFVKDKKTLILATGRDLTRWMQKNEQLSQLNRLYGVLTQCNRAINLFKDKATLFENIARIVTDEGGFRIAWFGAVGKEKVEPICISGHDRGYVDSLDLRFDNQLAAKGPVIMSIRDRKAVCINNIIDEPDFGLWRDRAHENGLASIASLPIIVNNTVENVLVLYSDRKEVFDERLVNLLQNLAEDITNAQANILSEEKRKEVEQQFRRLSSAVDQSADAILIMSPRGEIEYINPKFEKLTGYGSEDVLNKSPKFLCFNSDEADRYQQILRDLPNKGQWRGEFHYRKKDGRDYWSKDVITPIRDDAGNIVHYVSTSEDFTALREAQNKINQLAFYDTLTGLANKRLVLDRIRQSVGAALDGVSHVAVMFVDLDKFKSINDTMGHDIGDTILKTTAQRLVANVKALDTVARMGADEFVIVISRINNLWDAAHIAQRMLDSIQKNIDIGGMPYSVSASIGIAISPDDGRDEADLIRKADMAMYHAKSEGRNNFQYYKEEMNKKAVGQLDLERKLKLATKNGDFELFYQPQVSIFDGSIIGVEALLRWPTKDGGMIPPLDFIPLAEESGLMPEIGVWVLKQACRDALMLTQEFGEIKMAVNLSVGQFNESEQLLNELKMVLQETKLNPNQLQMEITESMLIEDVDMAIATMNSFRELGVSLAIDDFGTGYSSLSYLTLFPVDCLKIDKSFVSNMMNNRNDSTLTSAIISLGHNLGMNVLAEGVETESQLEKLKVLGCDNYQGYHFARPMPLNDVKALLAAAKK